MVFGMLLASSFLTKISRLASEPGFPFDMEITNETKTASLSIWEQANISYAKAFQ